MPEISRRFRRLALAAAIAAIATLSGPAAAHAGTYTVTGTCGLWTPWNLDASKIAVYSSCPTLIARQAYGATTTSAGVGGGWWFIAPPGTAIVDVSLQGSLKGYDGWQADAYTQGVSARTLVGCPGPTCPGAAANFVTYPTFYTTTVVLRVRCGATTCSNNADSSLLSVSAATFTLADGDSPSAILAGGALISGGWRSGTGSVVVQGSDNTGIQETRALIDGSPVKSARSNCAWGQPVPCPNGNVSLDVPTGNLSDGAHTIAGQVVDASGNVSTTSPTTFYVDNTSPTAPLDAQLDGSPGWRATNSFDVKWKNPPQSQAPIAGVAYRLCPTVDPTSDATTRSSAQKRCVEGSHSGQNISEIKDLEVPDAGSWDAQVWLIDAAGNQQPSTAAAVQPLAFDDTPPSSPTFLAPDPQDPARVHVQAGDGVSGIASGAIEVRRDGQDAWQPLATQVDGTGLTAFMDDEVLPKGLYFLRARVVDGAGLEASNDRKSAGDPAMLKLPIRLASHLAVGKRGKRVCAGHGKNRHCVHRLATKPKLKVGQATRLYGRLVVGGQPVVGTPVEVWRQLDLVGAQWVRLGTVATSKTGRFSYRAQRGPARKIRFRYPGTGMIRGRNGDVALRVRARTTLRPSRHNAINGEYVTFRGHLTGGWIPASGVLVELQVYSRGQWRTFAQPRAAAGKGRWSYRYRFETVSGHATFRFRARVRRQPDYPFTTGASSATHVKVRGL